MYRFFLKRLFDICFSLIAIIILSPLLLIIGGAVRINLGSPVIFRQDRPGKNEKVFQLYKFRSMSDARDPNGKLLPDKERLTKFGHMLRTTSLDELPELLNILKGDMSIIGPRPLAVSYLPFYSTTERERHAVRPGLTGLAQIHGRTAADWETRFKFDLEYVHNITFKNDMKIFFLTIVKVFSRADVVEAENQVDFDIYRKAQRANDKK